MFKVLTDTIIETKSKSFHTDDDNDDDDGLVTIFLLLLFDR